MAIVDVSTIRPSCPDHGETWSEWNWLRRGWECVYGTPLDPALVGVEAPCEKSLDGMGGSAVTVRSMTSL